MTQVFALQAMDWLNLFLYYLSISLLAVGGAIATATDMHRYLVNQQAWLTDVQFNASIAIAQAAPGPNVLFVALIGWHVGLNAAGASPWGWALGLWGALVCMVGIMLPSTTLTWLATRWAHRNRQRRSVRAFKQGMAPVVIGLLMALFAVFPFLLAIPAGRLVDRHEPQQPFEQGIDDAVFRLSRGLGRIDRLHLVIVVEREVGGGQGAKRHGPGERSACQQRRQKRKTAANSTHHGRHPSRSVRSLKVAQRHRYGGSTPPQRSLARRRDAMTPSRRRPEVRRNGENLSRFGRALFPNSFP